VCLDVDAVEAFANKRADSDCGPINKK